MKSIVGIPFGYRGFSDSSLAEMPVSVFSEDDSLLTIDLFMQKKLFLLDVSSSIALV